MIDYEKLTYTPVLISPSTVFLSESVSGPCVTVIGVGNTNTHQSFSSETYSGVQPRIYVVAAEDWPMDITANPSLPKKKSRSMRSTVSAAMATAFRETPARMSEERMITT